jgi:hypothetical protein
MTVSKFVKNSQGYSQVKVHHWYQRHRWQICHQYQRQRRQIFPPFLLALLIPVANCHGVNDTGGKFATGVNDAGDKLPLVSMTPAAILLPV